LTNLKKERSKKLRKVQAPARGVPTLGYKLGRRLPKRGSSLEKAIRENIKPPGTVGSGGGRDSFFSLEIRPALYWQEQEMTGGKIIHKAKCRNFIGETSSAQGGAGGPPVIKRDTPTAWWSLWPRGPEGAIPSKIRRSGKRSGAKLGQTQLLGKRQG